MKYVRIGLCGAAGALSRYLLGLQVSDVVGQGFPWATLLINLTGCFLFGLLSSLSNQDLLPASWQAPLTTGFVGSFTTFSSWIVDTMLFLQAGNNRSAALNLIVSIGLGLPLIRAGFATGQGYVSVTRRGLTDGQTAPGCERESG